MVKKWMVNKQINQKFFTRIMPEIVQKDNTKATDWGFLGAKHCMKVSGQHNKGGIIIGPDLSFL